LARFFSSSSLDQLLFSSSLDRKVRGSSRHLPTGFSNWYKPIQE
jgi:hypothetical protein